ncbi:putative quinol monooxygenase [Terriglobus roseus]|uniref:Quinol monooxygenase YgiN n=1 Tax=Terriglobus roseus TaxID=392734 RepID=A0A1H4SEY5_9BACT|nr:antibiotic biosynthesis monooxygenase [Terriglobus roseus]SEC42604.1 Quinol monooxygenase YgiN [Terriglobus roseus]
MQGTIYRNWLFATLAVSALTPIGHTQTTEQRIVRIAELEIDPNQLMAYKEALKEEIEASIQLEPGVSALYALSVKDHANQIPIFECYSDQSAYESHLQTAHFLKYTSATQIMVKSLKLIQTDLILLGSK